MNICLKGREMLLDLKRAEWLPQYDDEGVRTVLGEINEIFVKLDAIVSQYEENYPDPVKVTLVFYYECLNRNFRYINSYLSHRNQKLQMLRWEVGGVIPASVSQDTLSDREKDYFMNYSNLLADYNEEIGIDLTSDLEPPKELLIEVRATKFIGEIMTENGPISLEKGSTTFLRRSEVEQLIRDGDVEHILNHDQY